MHIYLMHVGIFILLILSSCAVHAQFRSAELTPIEQSLGGITGISDRGFPVLHNPAAYNGNTLFLSLGSHYRGTGIFILNGGCAIKYKAVGTGIAIGYFGDAIYRQWSVSAAGFLDFGCTRVAIGTDRISITYQDNRIGEFYRIRGGFQTKLSDVVMIGAYFRTTPLQSNTAHFLLAAGYRLHEHVLVLAELEWSKRQGTKYRIGGSLQPSNDITFRFGVEPTRHSGSLGLEYSGNCFSISFSLSYHSILGTYTNAGFMKPLVHVEEG